MSVKEQMMRAKQLIQEKKFDEARDILETVDHPKAKEWLAKIDAALPKSTAKRATRKSSKPKAHPKKSTKSNSRPNYLIPIIGLIVILLIAGGAAALIIPNLSNNTDSSNDTTAIDDAQAVNNDEQSTNNNADAESDNDESDETNTGSIEVVASGVRIPILSGSDFLFEAELPEGYTCECDSSSNRIYGEDRSNYFRLDYAQRAFDPDYYLDKSIDEMLTETIRDDETLSGQETVQVNGRDVVIARIADEDGETEISYNIKDSDGHIVRVIIPNFIDEPETLHEAALLVASNIEGASGDAPKALFDQLSDSPITYDEATNLWIFRDPLDTGRQNSVELPESWAIEVTSLFRMAVKDGNADTSATAIGYQLQRVRLDDDQTFTQWVDDYSEQRETDVESQEVVTVNNREIVIQVENSTSLDQRTTNYYVADSDGDLIVLITQSMVENQEVLREDIVAMASTVESEELTWEEQLRSAGILEE